MSTTEKIARAYGVLAARGEKLTVRAVQREAGVRIGEVAAWMREHATGAADDVPEAPDMSEAMSAMMQSFWAAAWKRAAEQADEVAAAALDAARTGEADALVAAEQAEAEKADAVAARDRAVGEVEGLRAEVKELRKQLEAAQADAVKARTEATQADHARVRAEAASDTLREVLDTLRSTGDERAD